MVTCRLFGVFPLLGPTESQLNPAGLVVAVAVNPTAVLSVLVTEMVFITAAEPVRAVTLMEPWLTFSSVLLPTLNVTGITRGAIVEPGTLSVTLPLHTCAVLTFCGLTDTITWLWLLVKVLPLDGVAVKKPAQLVVLAATWKFNGAPLLVTVKVWLEGAA